MIHLGAKKSIGATVDLSVPTHPVRLAADKG
jgi:hypothetical protein